MKNFASRLLLALLFMTPLAAHAESTGTTVSDCAVGPGKAYDVGSTRQPTISTIGQNCITGTISASLSGFAPAVTGSPISVTTGGVTGTLPAGAVVAAFNIGATNTAYCKLGASSTTNDIAIPPSSWFSFTVGVATQMTCITSTSTTTVNLIGGSGLPTGAGGGGGGSGGGGAITAASGSYAAGALSAGAGVDGWDLTQGAKADAKNAATDTTPITIMSVLKQISASIQAAASSLASLVTGQSTGNTSLATIATNTGAAVPAGTAHIGTVGIAPYPDGATPYTATNTGTTAATTATLTGASSVTTYICGFSIRANANAAATDYATVTGVITATLNFTQWTAPNASGLGVTEEIFSPCIPASGTNQSIAVISAAPGTGGVVSVTAWGYKL